MSIIRQTRNHKYNYIPLFEGRPDRENNITTDDVIDVILLFKPVSYR